MSDCRGTIRYRRNHTKQSEYSCDLLRSKLMKTLSFTVSSFASTSLSHCFSLLYAFLYSKPFQNSLMHCEIIDRYFNVFLLKYNWKKKTWKVFFGRKSLGAQTGIPVSQTALTRHWGNSLPLSVYTLHLWVYRATSVYPAGICLLKVINRNTRTRCEICTKLTIKTPERRH